MTFIASADWLTHRGSVGRPILGAIHIMGEDNETELAPNEEGAVFFESENVFEYHGDNEKTASSRNSKGWSTLGRSEEHASELQSLMRISYAAFCLTKKTHHPEAGSHPSTSNSLRRRRHRAAP